ncbi:phage major capsid protein [Bradyrhizobium liaoningense]|uniref:phage major capsid protein n=1 Tax=Bradyrhizobium liaoningense TaxID=43992 RepID=UPI001BA58B1B|nr:phage major capsid protein [Bradyrhizobium liaoningense]MBR0855658.1 phage major capsid protein [Bradyrhizobium liaoningense]
MKRYTPLLAFVAIVALATVAVVVFDYSAVAHAHTWGGFVADAGGLAALEKQITEMATQLKTAADDVKKSAETTQTELKNLGKITDDTKKAADDALIKHNEISQRMTELEQKMTQIRQGGGPERQKTIGEQVTENEEVKDFLQSGRKGRVSMKLKAIVSSLTTNADGSAGDLIVPQRLAGVITPPHRRMTIRDLLTPGRTNSNAIQYVKETGFTNNAATVSETSGATKPQSDIKFDLMTTSVTTVAHWVKATRQILSDVPQLQSYIDGRLRYGLAYVEENQLLNGSGTGTDLNGINTQATSYAAPIAPSAAGNLTKIDVIRLAILQAFLAEYPANGIVMHPSDWADIELTKTDVGDYLMANPQGGIEPRLWRLPVVETQAETVDNFLVGAFQLGAQIFDREDASVEISTEDSDNFVKNLVTILAEERLALAVYRPESFIKGTFSAALAA